ncbi:alpha-L-rhamnosidase [Anaerocolumna jejuensis DSM 15929]|uniref:alpha-L-rhamnosidase n=1 Tax=Anaerocolumna jejuensis DSM 15929 TaxID=1121322 RepID=A0A1M7BV18_9FIRM|nr:alpha-L-rhamnosidase [Anaerocolumna jejuensis]SHL58784.1 alpha-L-rhamnosidase [Anaerocolumna jejuensis DSM 15929]
MLKITSLKIEGLSNCCITDRRPNISFSLESDREGESLSKAVIMAGSWSCETVDQVNNLYGGELEPFTRYEVKVEAVGSSGETAKANTSFETGRLHTSWKAKWITDLSYNYSEKVSPVPMTFRSRFYIKKIIRRAWVNATALGVYELMLNGEKVGEDYFAPGFTSYDHQIQYQTYDITDMLKENNTVIAIVAGGWAAGSFNYKRKNKISADRQAFLCELYLMYEDGTQQVIRTDETWQVTEDGNYRMAEWYDGETYDATVDLGTVRWKQADATKPRRKPEILSQYGSPVRIQQIRKPQEITQTPSGELIYDFGQNFAGMISARLKGKKGQQVIFRHAEVLVNGELFVKSLRTAKATATYYCLDGEQSYSPRLTYMGFRYVGVTGIGKEDLELTALVLHSDFEETGSFACSNELINKLQSNIRWGGKSNFVDIPTDCPQRDERQGWTGDFAVFARTACYNFDMGRFIDKWLMDMRAEQSKGGGIPMVIPKAGDSWPVMANSCWGDSCILVPWAEYLARGDLGLLKRQYPAMKKFLKAAKWWSGFLSFTPNSRCIWRFPFHFGDWCAPDETVNQWLKKGKWVGTAYFANSCGIVSEIAELLGEKQDAEYYRKLRSGIIKAYSEVFTDGKGKLKREFQTAYVLPLYFDMAEGEERKKLAANLAKLVKAADNHLTTGFTGTPYLLFALSDNGYCETAYDVLLQEGCPSWLYEVKTGGTTIWERWDALRPDGTVNIGDLAGRKSDEESGGGMVSFNHYANGAVGDWLYRRMAGIEAVSGGYKTFRIAPMPDKRITWAKGSIITPYGRIYSDWRAKDNNFTITVEVPVSTQCTLLLPNGEQHCLASGSYSYSCHL